MPRATMHRGKTLINHLESEEKKRQVDNRDFDIPDYRTGDVVKFTMYGSLSEKKEYDYSGVVIRKQAPNSINARCTITFAQEGVSCMTGVSLFSPLLKSFEIQRYGSNQLRKKLNHILDLDISAGRLQEPIQKGLGYKQRTPQETSRKPKFVKEEKPKKAKLKKMVYKLDSPQN